MKSSILYAGAALACALGLSACGGGDGDLPLSVSIVGGVTKTGLVLVNKSNGDEIAVPAGAASVQFPKYLATDDEFNIGYKSLPSNVSDCAFTNNKARANYYTVYTSVPTVFCTIKTHPLTVTVKGLTDAGLVLVNGSDRQPVTPNGGADVAVKMAEIPEDGPYGVTILSQPGTPATASAPAQQTQTCTISGGSGNMTATGPGTTPVVTCGPKT
jgi:hypothetical protein